MNKINIKKLIPYGIYALVIIALSIVVMVFSLKNDHEYHVPQDQIGVNEEIGLKTTYLNLRDGHYNVSIGYSASEDVLVRMYLDDEHYTDYVATTGENAIFTAEFDVVKNTDIFRIVIPTEYIDFITISDIAITNTSHLLYSDCIWWGLLILILGTSLGIAFYMIKGRAGRIALIALSAVTLFSCFPLLDLSGGWDTWGHLLRIESVKDAFELRQFPVFIFPRNCNGFGQNGGLYSLTPLYLAGFIRHFRVSIMGAYKTVYVIYAAATAVIAYYSAYSVKKSELYASIFTIVYMLSPYRVVDLYCRHALGEIIAITFFPMLIAGLYQIAVGDYKKKWWMFTIACTGIVQAHVISTLVAALLTVFTILFNIKRFLLKDRLIAFAKALAFALLLNIWYLIPFVRFYMFGTGMSELTRDFIGYLSTFNDMIQGAHYTWDAGMATFGVCGFIGMAVMIYGVIRSYKSKETSAEEVFIRRMVYVGFLFTLMITVVFPWRLLYNIPGIESVTSMMQYPSRFMLAAMPMVTFISCYYLFKITPQKVSYVVTALVVVTTFLCVTGYMVECYKSTVDVYDNMHGGMSKTILPENFPKGATDVAIKNQDYYPYSYDMAAEITERDGNTLTFLYVTSQEEDYIDVPIFYFPGYAAEVVGGELPMGTKLETSVGNDHRVKVTLPQSLNGTWVRVWYRGENIFFVGYAISVIAIIAFGYCLIKDWKRVTENV